MWDVISNGNNDNSIFMKNILIAVLVIFASHAALGQIELNLYGGYVPNSKTMYSYDGYRIQIDGAGNFGVGLGYSTPFGLVTELSYMRFSSDLFQVGGVIDYVERQPINVEYYQLGVSRPFVEDGNFWPYWMFSLGATRFDPTEQPKDYWRFSMTTGLGIKYFFTDVIGIKAQARLLLPLYFNGIGFGCGIGTGGASCGGGAGFGSEIVQGDFTGGVVLRFGNQ